MKFKRLFTPITINGMALKNRLVQAPIHMVYCPDGTANERITEYYCTRAHGGVGLIITGGCRFDDYGYSGGMMSLHSDEFIPSWLGFTNAVHAAAPGVKVAVQLYHSGRYAKQKNIGTEALGPSAVFSKYTRETPRAMTIEDIRTVTKKWAEGAARAKAAGFDAVEILGSAGYLISQFLSVTTNQRTDEYGGSWENRCRFPLEVIHAVRAAVGPEYPIIMRIGGNDFIAGSNTNEDAAKFAKCIEDAGVDLINVTGGWHESPVPQITGDLPRSGYSYLAAGIKKAVGIPVIASNRNTSPAAAEEVLALGRADMICLGRPLIADPEWPNKAMAGLEDEIRFCLGCNQGCLAKTFFGNPVECLVNGRAGREYLLKNTAPAALPKNILVIGAGPAGCEFAIEATKRGHHVTIWEKEKHIGGQLPLAAAPVGKEEFTTIKNYYATLLAKMNIALELNHNATAEEILHAPFDEIVIATGSEPIQLSLQSAGNIPVVSADDVLWGTEIPGRNVVVIGGGAVGCETAQYLADRGTISSDTLKFLLANRAESIEKIQSLLNTSDRNISIVEMQQRIGNGFDPGCAGPVLRDLKRLNVKQYTLAKVKELTKEEAVIVQETDAGPVEHRIPCDTVVVAIGRKPSSALADALQAGGKPLHVIGDAKEVGKVLDAVHQALELAATI